MTLNHALSEDIPMADSDPEHADGFDLPPITVEGVDVGVLGFDQDGVGDPFSAELYITDGLNNTATMPLGDPRVLRELLPWLHELQDAQYLEFGLPLPAARHASMTDPDDGDVVDVDDPGLLTRIGRRAGRIASRAVGWHAMESGWSRTPGVAQWGVVGVVLAIIVGWAVLAH